MLLTFRINIPSKLRHDNFQISSNSLVWALKMNIISQVRNFEEELNFGLVLVDHDKNTAVFLDESQSFESLGIYSDVKYLD